MKIRISFSQEVREVLLWCLPALLVGLALRVAMEISLPYGYIAFDTADFLLTPFKFLTKHHYVIHPKKAFLSPLFFTIPFLLHIPALIFIPTAQHLMALLEVVLAGALIRLWFPFWRWIILPATLLIAAYPWQLWYEQTLMGEANYVFFLFLVALTGTWWAARPNGWRLAAFALTLFLISGTRAEGKLILLYGAALVPLVYWRHWKMMALGLASLAGVVIAANRSGGGGDHAYSLLYATLFRLTPDELRCEPGLTPYLIPLRDQVRQEGEYSTGLVALAKEINARVAAYQHDKQGVATFDRVKVADMDRKLCIEVLTRDPLAIPIIPLIKFRLASDAWPSGSRFDETALHPVQIKAVERLSGTDAMSGGLIGRKLDKAGWATFINTEYDPAKIAWFDQYQDAWARCLVALRLPDRHLTYQRSVHDFISTIPHPYWFEPGVPIYFLLAFAGMAASFFIPTPLRRVQAAWIGTMLFTWYCATMVGVTNARFRFGYEPFCYIYAIAAIVFVIAGIRRLISRPRAVDDKLPAPST